MKTALERFQPWLFCAVALGIGSSLSLAAAAADSAAAALAKTWKAIPWSQLGAKAGTGYQGDGLAAEGHESPVLEVAFLGDGDTLVSVGDDQVRIWRAASLAEADGEMPKK